MHKFLKSNTAEFLMGYLTLLSKVHVIEQQQRTITQSSYLFNRTW